MTQDQALSIEKSFSTLLFISFGVVFWATGVLFIRFAGKALFVKDNPWLLLAFAICIPLSWGFVKIGAVAGQVDGSTLLKAVSL